MGTINCIKDFSCKPVCFNYYEEPEEVEVEVRAKISDISAVFFTANLDLLFNFNRAYSGCMIERRNLCQILILFSLQEGFNFDNIIQTPRQALEFKRKQGDDISFHEGSIIYSDIDSALTPSETGGAWVFAPETILIFRSEVTVMRCPWGYSVWSLTNLYHTRPEGLTNNSTEASVYTTSDESEASSILDPDDPFSVKRKALRKIVS